MNKTIPNAIEILRAVNVVAEDADQCYKLMSSDESQLAKRNWIRAYFAWVEAMCFFLRRLVIEKRFQKRVIRPSDIAEYAALSEVKYTVTPKGEAIEERSNTRTLDYISFSLMACSRMYGLVFSIDRGSKAGQNLVLALRIRDRITHPKSLNDIEISEEDIKIVEDFSGWFGAHLEVLSNDAIKAKVRKEKGIAKRTKKARTLVFDENHFNSKA